MSWKQQILDIAVDLGKEGLDKLEEELERLESEADEPWKRVTLAVIGDLVEKHGLKGLDIARDLILDVSEDRKVPDLSDLSIATASDVLAELQKAEAEQKSAASKYIVLVTEVLTDVLQGLIQGIL